MEIGQAIGSAVGAGVSLYEGAQNRALQKKFAKKGIQWKVKDAKKAGIHPLYAMGAQTHSFSPVSTGAAGHIAELGQNIDRAMQSTEGTGGQVAGSAKMIAGLQADRLRAETSLLKAKIASELRLATQPGTPPARPGKSAIPGQGDMGIPMYVKVHDPRNKAAGTKWIINPEIASDFGESLAPEVLPHIRKPVDRMHQTVNNVRKQSRLRVRKVGADNWWDYLVPSIKYERR